MTNELFPITNEAALRPKPAGHRVLIEFDDGVYAKLICPESGCEPPRYCARCGRYLHPEPEDDPVTPCYDCEDADLWSNECWIKTWFDNLTAEELLHGSIEVPIRAEWDGDHIVVHLEP